MRSVGEPFRAPARVVGQFDKGKMRLRQDLLDQYVPQARQELVKAAREHRLVPYSEVTNALGTSRAWIGEILDEVNSREHAKGRPLLSAIVVGKQSRRPGPGFWRLPMLPQMILPSDRARFWKAERDKVWAFDWPSS